MPKETQPTKKYQAAAHQCPEMGRHATCPIDRLGFPDAQPVRLTGWVSEVRQIPVKEERRVLWYASDE